MTARAAAAAADHTPGMLVRYGNFLFKYRDQVFPAVLLALFLFTHPHWPDGRDDYDGILDLVGFCVALLGQTLRAAVVGYAYIIRGGRDKKVYAEELVTRGFFNHSRNPLYVGNLLILFGLLIIWNAPVAYIIGVPFFVLGYMAIVAAEEAFLRRKFGAEYDAYAARVPRWWVRLGGFRESMAGMEFNWRRVVVKEYGSAAYWVAGAFALMIADSLVYRPWGAHQTRNTLLVTGIALAVALWGWARWLKKSKRLRA